MNPAIDILHVGFARRCPSVVAREEADVGGHPRGILLLLNVFFHKIKIMTVQRTLRTL
jgi:hypothetical protein